MLHKGLAIFFTIVMVTGVGTVCADMVILKSGEMYQTRRAWKENGVVKYYKNGQVVRVDESEVDRLIHATAPAGDKTVPELPPAADPPSDVPVVGQPLPPPLPTGDDAGYHELKWGQSLSKLDGMTLVGTDPAYGGVQQYTRKQGKKRFGRASVDNLFFGFWEGGLYTILVEVSNFLDFRDLKIEAFRRFGEGRSEGDNIERYRWTDRGSDRLLSYDYDSDAGYLWMRSRMLHEKVRARYPQ